VACVFCAGAPVVVCVTETVGLLEGNWLA